MPGDASLAKLFRDSGERREIERVERGAEWVAVLRGSERSSASSALAIWPRCAIGWRQPIKLLPDQIQSQVR